MIILLIHLLRLLPFLCGGHRQLALENLALRQQLAVYKRTVNRPKLQRSDRLLWGWLSRVWPARTKGADRSVVASRSEEHTSELQSPDHLVCRLLLEKKKEKHARMYTAHATD